MEIVVSFSLITPSLITIIKKCWDLPKNKLMPELKRFVRDFNRSWQGDSSEFLYLKIFEKPEDLGRFVLDSSYMLNSEELFRKENTEDITEWLELCKNATIKISYKSL